MARRYWLRFKALNECCNVGLRDFQTVKYRLGKGFYDLFPVLYPNFYSPAANTHNYKSCISNLSKDHQIAIAKSTKFLSKILWIIFNTCKFMRRLNILQFRIGCFIYWFKNINPVYRFQKIYALFQFLILHVSVHMLAEVYKSRNGILHLWVFIIFSYASIFYV